MKDTLMKPAPEVVSREDLLIPISGGPEDLSLPRFALRKVRIPFLATLTSTGTFLPDLELIQSGAGTPANGWATGIGHGHWNLMSNEQPLTRQELSEFFSQALLDRLMAAITDLRGGNFSSYSNWYQDMLPDGTVVLHTIPLSTDIYNQIRQEFNFRPQEWAAMHQNNIEDIAFDLQGNSLWSDRGQMMCTLQPDGSYSIFGSKRFIGGTRKFKGASGYYAFTGITVNNQTKAGVWGSVILPKLNIFQP